MYDFRLEEVADWIRKRGAAVVALQMPEGLKPHGQRIKAELEKATGATFLLIGDPCYGACDVDSRFPTYADALVQFGHSEIPAMGQDPRVLFVEVYFEVDMVPLLERVLPRLKGRVGLITTVQHVRGLDAVREWLESRGKSALIGRGDNRVLFDGQLLGCNISAAGAVGGEVEQFLYIGSGDFHPLSVAIETGKEVLVLDPLIGEVRDMGGLKDKILRQRHGAIVRAEKAQRYLVLVSTKVGQVRMDLALRLKKLLESRGKSADIVMMERFDPELLMPYQADAYVSTACPRIAVDDYLRYQKPILTPVELEIVLGIRDWSDYRMDFITGELDGRSSSIHA
ncbi:diphthamide biosynthesis enzyme Dph2 [Methanomassiliicoccus luminyensis]|uniref:diphthamide biosynthesis enzyme Dph2 n=1 Tax=Methanomassiliicoccus luminyensis TaxID=1080712 RepID=UPI0003719B11|nr:diphthamide biosynthesis enzyme Dph2 [Methanomassiliicoccus luminyensis]